MTGKTLARARRMTEIEPRHVSVKEVVFPFVKFEAWTRSSGPRCAPTGEVMGIDTDFARAFMKSWIAAGGRRAHPAAPRFLSVRGPTSPPLVETSARRLVNLGFALVATHAPPPTFVPPA